jgi:hypothetical protein
MIPEIPCNFPEFNTNEERGSLSFPGIVTTKPKVMSFLNTGPFNGKAGFKEQPKPIRSWASIACNKPGRYVCAGERGFKLCHSVISVAVCTNSSQELREDIR